MSTITSAPVFNTQVMGDFSPKPIITVEHGGHNKRDGKACLMEWVSIFTEDDFGDAPKCTNPVLSDLARRVNDSIQAERARCSLATRISQLAGTAVPPVHPAKFVLPVWGELINAPMPVASLSASWGAMVRSRIHSLSGSDPASYDLRETGLRALQEANRETPSSAAWSNVTTILVQSIVPRGDEALVKALDTAIAAWQTAAGVTAKPLSVERLKELQARAEKLWADERAAVETLHRF